MTTETQDLYAALGMMRDEFRHAISIIGQPMLAQVRKDYQEKCREIVRNINDLLDNGNNEIGVGAARETGIASRLYSQKHVLNACAAPDLYAALIGSERIEALHDELSENYARVNGVGRTTTAESTIIAKARIAEIRDELRNIRAANRKALAKALLTPTSGVTVPIAPGLSLELGGRS